MQISEKWNKEIKYYAQIRLIITCPRFRQIKREVWTDNL